MQLYPDCDLLNKNRDQPYAPEYGECEYCYRYDICKDRYDVEHGNKDKEEL